jgi:hypothetical protein
VNACGGCQASVSLSILEEFSPCRNEGLKSFRQLAAFDKFTYRQKVLDGISCDPPDYSVHKVQLL